MPKVPQYQESQRFGPAPDARFTVNGRALSLASGGETWGAVDRAGGQMRATGDQMGDIALEAMREYNETVAMDRLNRAEAAILDMQAEQALHKGRDALGDAVASGSELIAQAAGGSGLAGPHGAAAGAGKDGKSVGVTGALRTGLDKLRGELTQGLNPAQQKLFDLAFTRRGQEVLRWGAGWEAQQQEVYTTGTEDGRKALDEQRILAHYGDPEQVSAALGNIQYVEQRRGKRLGLAPEAVEANVTQAMQKALLPMFDAMIDKGELGQARNALKLFGPDLGAAKAAEVWSRIQSRIQAQSEALAARAEADRRKAAAEAEKTALKGAVDGILADVAPYPTLEEQREAALARADALPEPVLRDRTRAEIAREMAWRQTTRDAADARAALDLCRAAREEGLSPLAWRERLDRADLSEGARALALAWSEAAPEGLESAARTMTLLRAIERGRAGSGRLTEDDVLAAGLHGGLSERQTRLALACLKDGAPVSVSRLDDICLDLHLPPDGHGRVEAPAWLYEGMLRDLARHGLLTPGQPLSDETLAQSVTRVWQRRQTALAARGPEIGNAAGVEGFGPYRGKAFLQPRLMTPEALQERPPAPPPSLKDSFKHGMQDSVSGLWWRKKLPDILTPRELESLSWTRRLALVMGRTLGDAPTLTAGGGLGTLGGPAAPVTVPAGAVGLTEGTRAVLENNIRHGTPQSPGEFAARMGDNLTAALKGMAIGGATGAAGAGAQTAVRAAGGGALAQTAGGLAAEVATLPTAAAGMEGRLPEARDFADAAVLILGMKGLGGAGKTAGRALEAGKGALEARLRAIHEKTGIAPEQVLKDAATDPALQAELASGQRDVPARYEQGGEPAPAAPQAPPILAKPVLEKAKAGEYIDTETLVQVADTRPWAQALLNERLGLGRLKEKLAEMFDRAERKELSQEPLAWQFVTKEEAAVLAEKTGWNVEPGFTHTVTTEQLWHGVKRHGVGGESFEQYRNQVPLTREDIAALPELIRPENIVKGTTSRTTSPLVLYRKSMPNGFILFFEEVRVGKKQLAFKTMYKIKQ